MTKKIILITFLLTFISCKSYGELTVNDVISRAEELNGKKVTINGFFSAGIFYENRDAYENFTAEFLKVPILGEWKEGYYKHCKSKNVLITGVYTKLDLKGELGNYLFDITEFRPVDLPDINCLDFLEPWD